MSGLCGWLDGVDTVQVAATIQRMVSQVSDHDGGRPQILASDRGAVAVADIGRGASVYRDGRILTAIWGDAHFSDPGLEQEAGERGSAQIFARYCYRQTNHGIQSLHGAFALAVIDEGAGAVLLAVDRAGTHPLLYTVVENSLVFGSSADAINLHPSARPEIDPQGLYNYLYFHMVPGPATIYRGQQRLLPGYLLRYTNGRIETVPYWEMRFEEGIRRPFAELKQEFLDTLRSAVRRAAGNSQAAGAFLSGGTDSSTIAGLLGETSGEPARTFSIGFEAEGYDEMEYARIAAAHFETRHHEYYVTPDDVADAIPRIAAVHDQPFGNSSAVPVYYCARLARSHGVERLLGGDGGDELFGGNERYARQHVFSLYGRVPATLRKLVIEPLAYAIPGGETITLVRKSRSYIEQASVPMPARLETYNLLERFGPERIFTPDFLLSVNRNQPLALLNGVYNNAHAGSLINRMLALDLRFTLADNDLPKVARACELAQVEIAFPMLDDAVVAFSAQLEPRLKLKGTTLRYFFKEALRGFLPDAIIAKKKHGFGLPFGPWLQTHRGLRDLAQGSLADLKKRNVVRADFLDELVGKRVAEHAPYYGTMVWVLMMLEQWLQRHRGTP